MQDDQVVVGKVGQGLLSEAEVHLIVVVEHAAQGAQVGMRRSGNAEQLIFLVEYFDIDMPHIVEQLFLLGDAAHLDVDGHHAFLGCIEHEVDFLGEAVRRNFDVALLNDAIAFLEGQLGLAAGHVAGGHCYADGEGRAERHHLIIMHVADGEVGIRNRVAQNNSMDGEREVLRHQLRLEATIVDAVREEQHCSHIALVISSVQSLYERRQVRQLVGKIELLKIADILAEKVFIDLKISVQVFPKLLKLGPVILLVKHRILAKDDRRRIVVGKDDRWRLHRTELLPDKRIEEQQHYQSHHQGPEYEQDDIQCFAIVLFLVADIQQCGRRQTSQQRQS